MFVLNEADGRYTAKCIVNFKKPRIRDFVVDTGAKYTCCSYDYVDSSLKEEDFKESRTKILGGFVANIGMKFYECDLAQFTIGTVDFGKQKIWITFDERIADSLLGMDILSQAVFANVPENVKFAVYNDVSEAVTDLSASSRA